MKGETSSVSAIVSQLQEVKVDAPTPETLKSFPESTLGQKNPKMRRGSQLRVIFDTIDDDNSGEIDADEFMSAMKHNKEVRSFFGLEGADKDTAVAEEYFEKMFKKIDEDGDENISYEEFERHIAQMALKSIVDLRQEFESTLGAEKKRVNEKLSKFAAKQINKSQKKLGKALVKIRENEENLSNIEKKLQLADEKLEIYEKQKIARDGSSIKQLYERILNKIEADKNTTTQRKQFIPGTLEIMVINATNIRNNIKSQISPKRDTMSPYVIVTAPWIESQPMEPKKHTTKPAKNMHQNPKWDHSHNNTLSIDVTQKDILYKSSLLPLINIEIRDDDPNMSDQHDTICKTTLKIEEYLQNNTMQWKHVDLNLYSSVYTNEKQPAGTLSIRVRHVGNAAPEKVNTEVVNEKQIGAYILRSQEARDLMGIPEELATSQSEVAFSALDDNKKIDSLDDFEDFLLRLSGNVMGNLSKRLKCAETLMSTRLMSYKRSVRRQVNTLKENYQNERKAIQRLEEMHKSSIASLKQFNLEDKEKSLQSLTKKLNAENEEKLKSLKEEIEKLRASMGVQEQEFNDALEEQKKQHDSILKKHNDDNKLHPKNDGKNTLKHLTHIEELKQKEDEARKLLIASELKSSIEIKKLRAENEQLIGRVKTLEMGLEEAIISKRRNDKETALFREENEKLRRTANVLNATVRDLELAHSNVESEIIMETKVNTVLVRAQSIMDAFSNNEDKAVCRVDMETLLHDFDRSSRKLLDAHDESNRHMSFVRSKLEKILTLLGGAANDTHFRTSDLHFIPKRGHRQPPMVSMPNEHQAAATRLTPSELGSPPQLFVHTKSWQTF